ncbi:MAG: GreA/GreB family elongation factor [Sandaracinaceae bacterium]
MNAPDPIDKASLLGELTALLTAELEAARAAHANAIEGATHEEARPENDKDTRGLEQSYLARGHAERVARLEIELVQLAQMPVVAVPEEGPITVGALALLIDEATQRRSRVWLVSHGGGKTLAGGITTVTPSAPLGRAILGLSVDEEAEIGAGKGKRTLRVERIE